MWSDIDNPDIIVATYVVSNLQFMDSILVLRLFCGKIAI